MATKVLLDWNALERLGKGIRSAPKDLMITHYSRENTSGKTFGFHKMMDIAGELSGALILFGLLWFFGQAVLYGGAGFDIVWVDMFWIFSIGVLFFFFALFMFKKSLS